MTKSFTKSAALMRRARTKTNLSQLDLAEKIGAWGAKICLIENGKSLLEPRYIHKLSQMSGIPIKTFIAAHKYDVMKEFRENI